MLFSKPAHFCDLPRKLLQVDVESQSPMFDHDDQSFVLDTTLRSRQLRPIEPELFAGPTYHARVEGLTGASKRNFGLSALSMHRYDDVTLAVPLMLVAVETTSLLGQPPSKLCAFHRCAPADDVNLPSHSTPGHSFRMVFILASERTDGIRTLILIKNLAADRRRRQCS